MAAQELGPVSIARSSHVTLRLNDGLRNNLPIRLPETHPLLLPESSSSLAVVQPQTYNPRTQCPVSDTSFSSEENSMKRLSRRWQRLAITAVLVLLTAPAAAQIGQNFGELVGKVTDEQGEVLPGVAVTLTGATIMGSQTASTNEQGIYRFPAVPSGTCKITFELVGFSSLARDGIVVPVRQTITVDAQLKVAALQETVTVTGNSPVVDVENTKIGQRLDNLTLERVPTSRSIFGTTTMLPGMVMTRQDPAGLNASTSTGMTAHGATTYNLNYFGVTADTPQNYGSMYYMDYGAAEEISVDTAAMGAEIGGGGGANINIIPKSGGNAIKGNVYYSGTTKDLAADNVDDELRAQGITVGTRLLRLNDVNLDGGGPFVKDKVWWFGSFRNYTTFERVIGFPKDFESNLRNYSARVNYQITRNNQLSGFWTYNRKFQPNRGAGTTQPDPVTTINQQSPKNLYNLNYTSVLSENTFFETSSTFFWMHWPSQYSEEFYALPDAERTAAIENRTTGVFSGPEPTGERLRDSYRFQTNVGLTHYRDGWLGASHQFKTGFENWYGWGTDEFKVSQDTRLRYTQSASGALVPLEILAYNTPLTQETRMKNIAAFVQDRMTYPRVTLNLGLRYAFYDGYLPEQEGGGGRWFPRVTYAKVDPGFSWQSLAPRVGVVWKVTADAKTVGKASYSQYYEHMYTTFFSDVVNPNIIRTTGVATYEWFGDLNNNNFVDDNEIGRLTSRFTPTANSIAPDVKDPRTDEVTLELQRELANNLAVSIGWVQRWYTDNYADVNVGIPTSAYIPHVFADAGPDNITGTADDSTITLYDVARDFVGKDAFHRQTVDGTARYKGLELTLNKRMSNRWQLLGSYVWSRFDGIIMAGDAREVSDPTNPNLASEAHRDGHNATDQPHSFKLIGSYQAPYGIDVGLNLQLLSGLPFDRQFRRTLTQGSTTVRAEQRGIYRADTLRLVSLKADKEFTFRRSARISLFGEVHNLLNTNAGQGFDTLTQAFASEAAFTAAQATTAYFGRVNTIITPRIAKFGVRFAF
jgi:Carboxypeptidase regulatory-like domain